MHSTFPQFVKLGYYLEERGLLLLDVKRKKFQRKRSLTVDEEFGLSGADEALVSSKFLEGTQAAHD